MIGVDGLVSACWYASSWSWITTMIRVDYPCNWWWLQLFSVLSNNYDKSWPNQGNPGWDKSRQLSNNYDRSWPPQGHLLAWIYTKLSNNYDKSWRNKVLIFSYSSSGLSNNYDKNWQIRIIACQGTVQRWVTTMIGVDHDRPNCIPMGRLLLSNNHDRN